MRVVGEPARLRITQIDPAGERALRERCVLCSEAEVDLHQTVSRHRHMLGVEAAVRFTERMRVRDTLRDLPCDPDRK